MCGLSIKTAAKHIWWFKYENTNQVNHFSVFSIAMSIVLITTSLVLYAVLLARKPRQRIDRETEWLKQPVKSANSCWGILE